MDSLGFLGLAYGIAWVIIAAYLLRLARRQKAIERRLEERRASSESPGPQ